MKKQRIKIVSLLLAAVMVISFVPIVSASGNPSDEWFNQHFVEINKTGYFNTDSVDFYKNPVQSPDDKITLAGSELPNSFIVQYKFIEIDGTEWYILDTENWSSYSEYCYVSTEYVGIPLSKTLTRCIYSVGDKVTWNSSYDGTGYTRLFNEAYVSGDTAATNAVTIWRGEGSGEVQMPTELTVTAVKPVTDINGTTIYYYYIDGENWPEKYANFHYTQWGLIELSETANPYDAYLTDNDSNGISVQLSVPEGAFEVPYLAYVSPVFSERADIRGAIRDQLNTDGENFTLFDTYSYNITFTDESGNELIPKKEIGVFFCFDNGCITVNGMTDEIRLYHMAETEDGITAELKAKSERYCTEINTDSQDFSVYTVAAVGEDDIVNYSLTAAAYNETDNGLEVSKEVSEPDANGQYWLDLEAWATGSEVTTTVDKEIPTDIVLVLDQSGSMADDYLTSYSPVYSNDLNKNRTYYVKGRYSYTKVEWCSTCTAWTDGCSWFLRHTEGTKYVPKESESDSTSGRVQFYEYTSVGYDIALKNAVQKFADSVYEKAAGPDGDITTTEDNVNHRIAVVGFASGMKYNGANYNYNNTELFVGGTQYTYNAGSNNNANHKNSAQSHYIEAFQDMSTTAGYNNVIASKNALYADGGTVTNLGIEMANGIFNVNPIADGEDRKRIVILFTDGTPGWSGYDQDIADEALEQIYDTKTTYDATIYTIGIFSDANAEITVSSDGMTANMAASDSTNRFMHYLSSNYMPTGNTAQTMSSPGTKSFQKDSSGKYTGESYYLSAKDTNTLNSIFESISSSVTSGGSSITLDKNAVLKDIVSPYFALPEGTDASKIEVYTEDYTAQDTWSNRTKFTEAEVQIKDSSVDVTNFDYAANWVGTEDNNGTVSYRGKKLIVRIPIVIRDGFLGGNGVITNGEASGIYESSDSTEPVENFVSPTVDIEIKPVSVTAQDKNVYLFGSLTETQLAVGAEIKCGDIDLTGTLESWQTAYVYIETSTAPSSFASLESDTTYTVSCTVKPINEGKYNEKTGEDTANINVFKPTLTFKDTDVYYGDNAPSSYASNKVSEEWKHSGTSAVDMIGAKPDLTLTYTPGEGVKDGIIATKQDIPVTVSVKIGNTDINKYTAFEHQACSPVCDFPKDKEQFLLHVKTCSLTVQKSGGDAGEPYIFYIYKDGEKYTELTVTGNGSTTIYELPVGTYSVKEDTSWSWRFKSSVFDKTSVELNSSKVSDTVKCTNGSKTNQWINGFSDVLKNIFGISRQN